MPANPNQFLGVPSCPPERADAIVVPLPFEKTVSYGTGTWRAPRAILDASCQIELFDEETLIDFADSGNGPKIHTLPLLLAEGNVQEYLDAVAHRVAPFRDKFVLGLGGEHTVTYGLLSGLAAEVEEEGAGSERVCKSAGRTASGEVSGPIFPADLANTTVVQIDAHADLADELNGQHWSHGTVMRRLWERGCRLLQIGVRSLSRAEYELASTDQRITTYYAHQLPQRWPELLDSLTNLRGKVYLTIDVDGLDPTVIPSTGTPQPGGLSWQQTLDIIRCLTTAPGLQLIGADVVELVASPHPPGCDIIAARLAAKVLAFWWNVG
jgi:agmatinase